MDVKVNQDKCIGCGLCSNLCPEVFKMDEGKAKVKDEANLKEAENCIKEAVNGCPVTAIEFKE